jgi:glycosyltransferase involved in cell wall biosynthesis
MRIAVLDLTLPSVIGGSVTWADAILHGMDKLGVEKNFVTFTKSGKVPKKIIDYKFLRVLKYDMSSVDALNEYSHIILNCQGKGTTDRKDFEAGIFPKYLDILREYKGKLFIAAHSTYSMSKRMYPYVDKVFSLPSFQKIFFMSTQIRDTYELFSSVNTGILNTLPFKVDTSYDFSTKVDQFVFIGRIGKSKGTDIFLNMSDKLYGSGKIYGPRQGFSMYEIKDHPMYCGEFRSYEELKRILGTSKIIICPTRQKGNVGFLHYVALEALYFGAIPIYPEHWGVEPREFTGETINVYGEDFDKAIKFANQVMSLSPENLRSALETNHAYIVNNHSSEKVASELIGYMNAGK